ncbi:MAG: ABC transporter permease, partial [Oribacterium sp.]
MKRNWEALQQTNEERERIWRKTRSFAGDVWSRFRKKPTAIAGFLIIVLLVLFSVLGPLFTGKSYSEQDLNAANIAPRIKVFETPDGNGWLYITQSMKLLRVSAEGDFGEQLNKLREDSERQMLIFDYEGSELGLYYGKKPYLVVNPDTLVIAKSRRIRNRDYLLGTDSLGRDILTRLMYGSRVSLVVAFVAVIVNLLIGILYGGVSGYLGGNVDEFMMRIVDIISTIPLTLYVILIMVLLGSGLSSIIVALGSVYWVGMARVVRGQVLSLKQQEFVLAARTIGSSTSTILFRHLIPNAMGAILVTATMLIPSAIFMEAFLGFLG